MTMKEYKHLYFREKDNPERKIRYKAVSEQGEIRCFHNRDELASFLGYNKDYINRLIQKKQKVFGWTIIRHKWFEDSKIVGIK